MSRPLSPRVVVLSVGLLAIVVTAAADSYVTILHFNDFHGYLQPVESEGRSVGGLARIATAAAQVREWNSDHNNLTLLLEAGDILQGTPLSMTYRGEPDVLCLNRMGLDAMCVGNHEFDFGQDNLKRLMALAKFPILSANVYVAATGDRLTPAVWRFALPDGTRGAAFGLTTASVAEETLPSNFAGLRITDPVAECQSLLTELQGQAQFLVVLTHLGYEEDLALARACPELDVIIGGHSHTRVEPPTRVGKTLVCQAESYGRYLGQLDMLVSGGDVVRYRGFLRPMDQAVAPDPEIEALIRGYAEKLDERLREVIAQAAVALNAERDEVRSGETNLGNLVTDLYREYTRADVCLVNAGGIRASIAQGPITVGDVLRVAPFSNLVAIKEVTGAQLRAALEYSAGLERPHGGFLQVSGLTMTIADGHLAEAIVGGEPLQDDQTYTLAATEFMLAGGDGYTMLTEGAEPEYLGFADNAILIEMLKAKGTVSPRIEGRISFR